MTIFAYKPGHDGHVAALADGELLFSVEAEKDSGARYAPADPGLILQGMAKLGEPPVTFAESGWMRSFRPMADPIGSGYFGTGPGTIILREQRLMGRAGYYFSSSHERSHLAGSYAMSPYPQSQPVYALVWEGVLGHFYRIDPDLHIVPLGSPMSGPGHKYGFLYGLADPAYPADARKSRREDAGKLMALAGFGKPGTPDREQQSIIDRILTHDAELEPLRKAEYADSTWFNAGLDSPAFHDLARRFQDAVFERFLTFAKTVVDRTLPILVSGGCGLNCDWNSAWSACGLFEDVFVQPCANDSGSAIGTAADAQFHLSGNAKIDWSVYAGEEFVDDETDPAGFERRTCSVTEVADLLADGAVLAWVQGRYEIGPRALGNRSLIAPPFTTETHARLNAIKKREGFRPIAPILLEEEHDRLFNNHGPSPYMLFFQTVKTDALKAVTHVDGSARSQTVAKRHNPKMHALLTAFMERTGYGVLCNTSLNFNGKGFINRMSDLARYARETGLDGFVVGDMLYRRIA